jgi:hypothetical protein
MPKQDVSQIKNVLFEMTIFRMSEIGLREEGLSYCRSSYRRRRNRPLRANGSRPPGC